MRRLGLLALLVIAAVGAAAGWLNVQIRKPYRGQHADKLFVDIPRGTSRWGVAEILKQDDAIRNAPAFALYSYWHFRRPLQAGEYLIDHQMNSSEIFWKIAKGEIFVHVVTVPEGWTMFDIAQALEAQGICHRDDFLAAARDTAAISDMAPQAESLEGFLFPSSYQFTRHTSCGQIADTMVRRFRSVWEKLDAANAQNFPQRLTLSQVVTLASLIERETPNPDERPLVAGVFYNRLRSGSALQCDPTVQYALERQGRVEKKVQPEDLKVDSPYNTYRHRGLPPGPISNPGEASLRAALEPAQTDFLYFVANDQGGHFFSKTLAEHNHNVARYRHLTSADARRRPS